MLFAGIQFFLPKSTPTNQQHFSYIRPPHAHFSFCRPKRLNQLWFNFTRLSLIHFQLYLLPFSVVLWWCPFLWRIFGWELDDESVVPHLCLIVPLYPLKSTGCLKGPSLPPVTYFTSELADSILIQLYPILPHVFSITPFYSPKSNEVVLETKLLSTVDFQLETC